MKIKQRPLFWLTMFFAIGIVIGNTDTYFLKFFVIFVICLILLVYSLLKAKYVVIYLIVFLLLGLVRINYQENKYHSRDSIAVWNDRGEYLVTGEIVENLDSLTGNKIFLKPYLVNSVPVKYGLIQLDKRYLPYSFQNGDVIKIKLSLRAPPPKKNPGGFSYRKYLKRKGVFSQGYLEGKIIHLDNKENLLKNSIIELKNKLIGIINYSLQYPYNEMVKALILGERDQIPEEWETEFSRAGVNHLLAISGLHVGFILIFLLGMAKLFGLSPGIRNFFITFFILVYIILTGARASVFRAGIFSILFLWAPYFKRKGDLFNILGLTALLNFIINPYALFNIGFQLSYTVVLSIVVWMRKVNWSIPSVLAVSIVAQIGSIPITALYFNYISPAGILTNVWAIPMAGMIVFVSFICLLAGLINPVYCLGGVKVIQFLLWLMKMGISFFADIPGGYIEVPSPGLLFLLFIYILIFILPFILQKKYVPINIKKRRFRLWMIVLSFILIINVQVLIPVFNSQLGIIFFSVGQGDGILLNLPGGRHIIVDGGGKVGLDSSQGEAVILPYLKSAGIHTIDVIFVTHFDTDHALGIIDVLEKRNVKLLVIPEKFEKNYLAQKLISLAVRKNVPVRTTRKGDSLKIEDVFLHVLHPEPGNYSVYNRDRNANSIVLKVIYKNFSLLLTGDLGRKGEWQLMQSDYILRSDILKLGHHGSNTSSGKLFLQKVLPREAIISVGENNYGHPSPLVVKRVSQLGIRTWNTEKQGAIIIKTDGNEYKIKGYLQNKKMAGNQPD